MLTALACQVLALAPAHAQDAAADHAAPVGTTTALDAATPAPVVDAGTREAATGLRDAGPAALTARDAGVVRDADGVDVAPWVRIATGPAPRPTTGKVARVVLGLFALLALAILAGHPTVRAFEKRAGLGMFAVTGMPFLALGALARLPSVGILSDDIVRDLRPMLEFGLGWIGFRVGTEFDVRATDRLPRGTGRLLATESACAFLAAGFGSVAALAMVGAPLYGGGFVRDGLVLGACAAVSAPSGARALEAAGVVDAQASRLIRRIAVLDDAVPIVVLALVTAVFRPVDVGRWHLPTLGWVFLQIGMGAALGMLTTALMRSARSSSEDVALTLGAIAFASGMAGYLGFSPLVVGCVAGIVVANLTTGRGARAFAVQLRTLERSIYMAFFAVAGAMWQVGDWRGWAIVPLYALARLLGKLLGARAAYLAERVDAARAEKGGEASEPPAELPQELDPDASWLPSAAPPRTEWISIAQLPGVRTLGIALIPTSAVSIAVIISARQAYPDSIAPYLETVVIVGAIVAELVLQFSVPMMRPSSGASEARESTLPPPPVLGGGP